MVSTVFDESGSNYFEEKNKNVALRTGSYLIKFIFRVNE